jgi:hypothetical protein
MQTGWRMMTSSLRALPFVLVLTAVPQSAPAQSVSPAELKVCYPLQPGETATAAARRLTGDAWNRRQAWFQIVDTTTLTVRRKADYGHVAPGWLACLPREMVRGSAEALEVTATPVATQTVSSNAQAEQGPGFDPSPIWVVSSFLLIALLAALGARRDFKTARANEGRLKQLGNRFIREFERPLFRVPSPDLPIKSQLRMAPHRGQLKVLIAPNGRRTYPNLSDHRKNLEYDIERILRLLGNELAISGKPYARGPWVVIPFQLKADVKEEGVT